jgi:predicted regulator of amino acid metabolism with ACT domain
VTVTFTPPTTASSGTFVGNSTVVSDVTGTATAPAYVANAVSGPDTVKATSAGILAPARFVLTNDPAGAQNIVVNRTQLDTTIVNTAFKDSLQVAVKDQFNNPVSGVWVTFTAPAAGASVIFARTGKTVDSALTTPAGLATSSALTANTVAGDYQIIARISGTGATATFFRTNKAGLVTRFAVELAPAGGPIGTQTATAPFSVLISARDAYNNIASFPGTVNINITSNGPLTAGGGIVAFTGGLIQEMVFQGAGNSDTIKVVRVGGGEKGASNAFEVWNPVPTVTAVSPFNGPKGQTLTVVLTGTGFINGVSSPSFGGFISPGTWLVTSSTQMTVPITISPGAPDGSYDVSVVNGPGGGGPGGIGTLKNGFTVGQTPAPKILSILPASGSRLQPLNVVIRGSGFYGGVSVLTMGSGIVVNSANVDSVNQITAGITILAAAATGPRNVVVTNNVPVNTGGGTDTLKGVFSVVNPIPTIYDVAPGGATRLSAVTIGISGTNYIGGVTTVSLGDTAIAVNSVTVDSATHITAVIFIGAGAATGLHAVTVTNAGPGGGPASLSNSFTVFNPVPTLTSVQPNAANRSQTLSVVFRGSNYVRGSSRVLFNSPADITVNSVSVDSVTQITASVTIGSSAFLGPRFVAVYTGGDTSNSLGFNVNLAAPPIPVLVSPANGSAYQPTTVALRWSPSTNATGYHVQFARVQTFLPPAVDTVVTDTFMVVGPLTMNTTYYWHVAATGASSTSSFSVPWNFVASYPARVAILDTVAFPARNAPTDYLSTDYRLIGLPGSGPTPVQNYLSGTAGTDWSIVWDNGQPANYWVPYAAGSPFLFGAGRGFWLVRKGNWIVKDTVAAAVLDGNGRASIALHTGWNIITDPFLAAVNWSDIVAANPPTPVDHPVFAYNSGWPQTTVLQPYAGYYFENTDSLAFLQVPFKSAPGTAKVAAAAAGSWRMRLELEAGGFVDQVTTLGASPDVCTGKNVHDFHRPRVMKGIPALVLARPEWDAVNRDYATDIRPPVQNVETWKFEVRTSLRTPVKISFRDVAGVPENLQVYLMDEGRARSADLRAAAEYPFVPSTDVSAFRVVVGTPDALRKELDALLPKAFELGNNFPNPFNPETTIPVSVPLASEIRLVVYNILGSEVRTVYAGPVEAGRYWFRWDGRNEHGNGVASGIYFVRLTTNRGLSFIRKMAFVK